MSLLLAFALLLFPPHHLAPAPFGWPLETPEVTRRFDPPPQPWSPGHRGVDLGGRPGATVRAAGAGTIVYAGVIAGRGVVSVRHLSGLRTTYEPVVVDTSLRVGSPVMGGQRLGSLSVGHAGCPRTACLHWGLRRGAEYLDPLALLGKGRVRLLPLMPH
jgi:murein DD-endopeptidase MepM/ murein hydrolase activator NlpD